MRISNALGFAAGATQATLRDRSRHRPYIVGVATDVQSHASPAWHFCSGVVRDGREQRELLGPPARTPALAIERLAVRDATPVEWRHGLVRADRFSYVARWTAQDLDAGFEPTRPAR
jgi:hypothetical protein